MVSIQQFQTVVDAFCAGIKNYHHNCCDGEVSINYDGFSGKWRIEHDGYILGKLIVENKSLNAALERFMKLWIEKLIHVRLSK